MNRNDQDDAKAAERFASTAAGLLRQGAEELDAATRSRLNRSRQAALAEYDHARQRPAWLAGGWRTAVAAAAVAVVAVGLWTGRSGPVSPDGGAASVEAPRPEQAADLDVVLAEESPELVEDLDFYDWIETDGGAAVDTSPDLTS